MKRRSTLAATAIGALAAIVISACSSSGSSSGNATPSTGSAAFNAGVSGVVNPSTQKGGTLVLDSSSPPDSFDPGNTYYAWVLNLDHLWAMPMFTFKACPGTFARI